MPQNMQTSTQHNAFKGFWSSVNALDQMKKKEIVLQLLNGLSSENRTMISLFYFENLTVTEIAAVMNLTHEIVQESLFTLTRSIRDMIQDNNKQVSNLLH